MKNETTTKINHLGQAGYVICKISKVVILIAAVACLIGGILMCIIPKDAAKIELTTANSAVVHLDTNLDFLGFLNLDAEHTFVQIGQNTYQLMADVHDEPAATSTVVYLSDVKWISFAGVIACVAVYLVFYFAEKLCAYFKICETPFTEAIAKQLTNLAWSLISYCLLSSLVQSLTDSVLSGRFEFFIRVDLITLLLILCVFMLSFVFKYGAVLQTESDETL